MWFDKKGRPITVEDADKLLHDPNYKVIGQTIIGKKAVSTVWLGIDHSFSMNPDHKPVIFETTIFAYTKKKGIDCGKSYAQVRYATEKEAIKGHKLMVKHLKEGKKWVD